MVGMLFAFGWMVGCIKKAGWLDGWLVGWMGLGPDQTSLTFGADPDEGMDPGLCFLTFFNIVKYDRLSVLVLVSQVGYMDHAEQKAGIFR